jgi:heme A synthase
LVLGSLYMVVSFFLAAWAYRWHRRRQALPPGFWRVQTGTIHLFTLQVLVGLVLLLGFHLHPPTKLHYLYAALLLLTVAAQLLLAPDRALGRMVREEGTLREAGTYAVLALLAGLFALRLLMTGLGLP